MNARKVTALLCAFALAVSVQASAFAAQRTDWPQFSGSPQTPGISGAPTPVSAEETRLLWSLKRTVSTAWGDANAWGSPVAAGGFLYATDSGGTINKLDVKTGKTIASAPCSDIPAYFCQIAYGDGTIFVPQQTEQGVRIAAFDADTLAPVWRSEPVSFGESVQQIASPLTYFDHRIYFGTYTQDANYNYNSGVYACLDAATGTAVWKDENDSAGYYWNGGAVLGGAIAVADTAGKITAFRLADGKKTGSVSAGGAVSSSLCYAQGRIYASVKSGFVFSVRAEEDGSIDSGSALRSAKLGNGITSSPVVYRGRLYVAGGGFGSDAPFSVLNASSLKTVYQIPNIRSQSTPLVTTAYASAENKWKVTIYVADYGTLGADYSYLPGSSRVFAISDSEERTTPSYEAIFTPSVPQSSTQSLTPSAAGTLSYFNDSGTLFTLGKRPADPDAGSSAPSQPQKPASSAPSQAQSSRPSAGTAGTASSAPSQAPLASPPTGEAPLAGTAGVLLLSAAAILVLKRRIEP